MIHSCRAYCVSLISDIANYIFFHNTTIKCSIKVTILNCAWCQAISSKSKCNIRMFPLCFPNTPYFFTVSVSCWYYILVYLIRIIMYQIINTLTDFSCVSRRMKYILLVWKKDIYVRLLSLGPCPYLPVLFKDFPCTRLGKIVLL